MRSTGCKVFTFSIDPGRRTFPKMSDNNALDIPVHQSIGKALSIQEILKNRDLYNQIGVLLLTYNQ